MKLSKARLLRMSVQSKASENAGYVAGFCDRECVVPQRFKLTESFWKMGFFLGQSDRKREKE